MAKRSIPKGLFDYIDGAAEGEVTKAANRRAFDDLALRPRLGTGWHVPDLSTTVAGVKVSLPVLLAPCGLVQVMHPDGVVGTARAAREAGTISVLSTFAGPPPEVLSAEPGPRWFQLYAADRAATEDLVGRAQASGYDALVITMDSVTSGNRTQDSRSGEAAALTLNIRNAARLVPQLAIRPRWLLRMATTTLKAITDPTLKDTGADAAPPSAPQRPDAPTQNSASPHSVALRRVSPFTWEDVAWIRSQWRGPLIVKSILSATDAIAAVEAGADAIIVSNHGGRVIDGVPATLTVLPEIVAAVAGRADVLLDSGVRRGSDVVKALALGARAVLIGRPFLYGLAADGQAGVTSILELFRTDIARTLTLMGCPSVADLDTSWVQPMQRTFPHDDAESDPREHKLVG